MMRTSYDPDGDVLHITFGPTNTRSDTSEEVAPGVDVEFDLAGNPIGIEITSAVKRSAAQQPEGA